MLAICRAKVAKADLRPRLYEQDMQALDLPRRYRTIIGSSSVLQLLADVEAAREALHRCFAHLEPGGAFVTPFTFDWREGEPLDTGWEPLFTKTRLEDGATVRSWVREWREPARQWWHTQQRFEVEVHGEVVEREEQQRSPEGRWYSQDEVVKLYRGRRLHRCPAVPRFRADARCRWRSPVQRRGREAASARRKVRRDLGQPTFWVAQYVPAAARCLPYTWLVRKQERLAAASGVRVTHLRNTNRAQRPRSQARSGLPSGCARRSRPYGHRQVR